MVAGDWWPEEENAADTDWSRRKAACRAENWISQLLHQLEFIATLSISVSLDVTFPKLCFCCVCVCVTFAARALPLPLAARLR